MNENRYWRAMVVMAGGGGNLMDFELGVILCC